MSHRSRTAVFAIALASISGGLLWGQPVTSIVTTAPAGLGITVDGVAYTSPQSFSWEPGTFHTVETASVQTGGSATYTFANWSDSGTLVHTINAPTSSTTVTATFTGTVPITVTTAPAGLAITADGVAFVSPHTFSWEPGSTHFIAANMAPTGNLGFSHWSDFGAQSHGIAVLSEAATYTAIFSATVPVTVGTMRGGLGFTVDGVSYVAAQTFNWIPGSPHALAASPEYFKENTMYGFTAWSNGVTVAAQTIVTPLGGASFVANYIALTYVTIGSVPAGLVLLADGTPFTSSRIFYWRPNSTHTLSTIQLQSVGGVSYRFNKWSNTGPMTQQVLIPESAANYWATFTPSNASTTLTLTGGPAVVGQPVTLTAAVGFGVQTTVPTGAVATGVVQFSDGGVTLGSAVLQQGSVTFPTVFASAGVHTIIASYNGDSNYPATSSYLVQTVNPIPAAVSLSPSGSNLLFGQALTLTAQVSARPSAPSVDGLAAPAGLVEFRDGSTMIGTAPLTSNVAVFMTPRLAVGSHRLTAVYAGDTIWAATQSGPLMQMVVRGPTRTALSGIAELTQVLLTATVGAGATGSATPAGRVQFVDFTTNEVIGTATIPAAAVTVSFGIGPEQMNSIVGHPVRAVFLESADFDASTSNAMVVPALTNSASGAGAGFAPDELVSVYGSSLVGASLATATPAPGVEPLPTNLGGASVIVTDSAGGSRLASLYLTSPGQINFVMPSRTAPGAALVTLTTTSPLEGLGVVPVRIMVGLIAPGLFGSAQILRVHADGSQTIEATGGPIAMGSDTLYLVLYGTGVRNRTALANVRCTIGDVNLPVLYAGAQPDFEGLDQVNVRLPVSLAGAGQVSVALTADGYESNRITLEFQ